MTELLNYENTCTLLTVYNQAYEKCLTMPDHIDRIIYLVDHNISLGICNAVKEYFRPDKFTLTSFGQFYFDSIQYRWYTPYHLYKMDKDPLEGIMPRIQWLTRRKKELM